jgi:hypothetical protein
MLELAKFAKQHIPEEHELDDPDFVDKRSASVFPLHAYNKFCLVPIQFFSSPPSFSFKS